MQLLITPLAAHDLEEIGDYIAQDSPPVGPQVLWLNYAIIAKRFASILRATGTGLSCLLTCAHARMVLRKMGLTHHLAAK